MKPSKELLAALPDEVPIPSARQIHKGWYYNETNTACCLLGWARIALTGSPLCPLDFNKRLLVGQLASMVSRSEDPAEWNDKVAKTEVARRWEQTMRKLGYKIV